MSDEVSQMAALVGMNPEIAEKLDQVLTGPNDRAYVMCTYSDCNLSMKGRCTIFTLSDVPRMKRGKPCDRYQPVSQEG